MKMALLSQSSPSSCYATTNKPHFLLPSHHHSLLPIPKSILLPPIKSQKPSSEPPISTQSTDDTSTGRNKSWSWKKTGRIGFGRAPVDTADFLSKQETIFQGSLVFGRAPVETPDFFSKQGEAIFEEEQSEEPPISAQSTDDTSSSSTSRNKSWSWKKKFRIELGETKLEEEQSGSEKAFVSAWLGLGNIIIIQGLLLAASGFFPEKWNELFVKYLYPAFTPTVFLFFAGAVVYGLLKYQQNEKPRKPK